MNAPRKTLVLADGTVVRGAVALYGGHYIAEAGACGLLRLAIANAEEGLPTGLFEPAPGIARIVDIVHGVIADVDLRGAEVVA